MGNINILAGIIAVSPLIVGGATGALTGRWAFRIARAENEGRGFAVLMSVAFGVPAFVGAARLFQWALDAAFTAAGV